MTPLYDAIGQGYAGSRRADPRIEAVLHEALGRAVTVLNVGAGTGSYEPASTVVAVEPSLVMVQQRPVGAAPVLRAVAEALPFPDGTFDAALAVLTTHHWSDPAAGLDELVRVSRRQVILTWDQQWSTSHFWFVRDYLPEAAERELGMAALDAVIAHWPDASVSTVPVPHDCVDGFFAAWWRRPEAFLSPVVRASISGIALLDPVVVAAAVTRLGSDLQSGAWQRRYSDLLELDQLDCGYRLVVRGD